MPLELHIWGPAFGLPSVDAECLAAVAYLRHAVNSDEWVLVASSDPKVCPTGELPALKSGTLWISRYRNIVDYLHKYSAGLSDLDRGLDNLQKADITAYALGTLLEDSQSNAEAASPPSSSLAAYHSSTSPSTSPARTTTPAQEVL